MPTRNVTAAAPSSRLPCASVRIACKDLSSRSGPHYRISRECGTGSRMNELLNYSLMYCAISRRRTIDLSLSYERSDSMSHHIRVFLAIGLTGCLPLPLAFAGDSKDKSATKARPSKAAAGQIAKSDENGDSGGQSPGRRAAR